MTEYEFPSQMTFVLFWETLMIVFAGTLVQCQARHKTNVHLEGGLSHVLLWLTILASVGKLVMLVNLKKNIEKYAAEKKFIDGQTRAFALASIPIMAFCVYVIFAEIFFLGNFWVILLCLGVGAATYGNIRIVKNYEEKMLNEDCKDESQELTNFSKENVAKPIVKNEN